MKKLFLIMLVLSIGLIAKAQETSDSTKVDSVQVVNMNRTFSIGGNALLLLRSNNASKRDMKPLEWTLKNDRIGDTNIVVLDVKNKRTGETEAHQLWSEGVNITMKTTKDGTILYDVSDDLFSHLRIMKANVGTIIMFYSELIKK